MALEVGLQTLGVSRPAFRSPVMITLYHSGGANRMDASLRPPAAGTVGRLAQLLAGTSNETPFQGRLSCKAQS
jgi:hypothetical protein